MLPLGEFTVRIPEPLPHATLQDAVTYRNQCHDRATLQGVRIVNLYFTISMVVTIIKTIPSAILKMFFATFYFFNAL